MSTPAVDLSPLAVAQLVEALARFSGPGPGVTRLAYDEAWCEAQAWLVTQGRARGLVATRDSAGNLYLHDPARPPGPIFLTGSHLDTVREGGALDGAYGVIAGLMLASALRGATRVPVAGLVTCEEEGSRFPTAFLGARALVGRVARGESDALRDEAGVSWREAVTAAAALGCAAPGGVEKGPTAPQPVAGFLELHIEQGPVLEAERLDIGIVDRIAGFHRVRVRLTGAARHAGTTPMRMRRDALAAAAEITLAVERIAREHGDPAVATVGAVSAAPGLYNVVAGACELRLDLRQVQAHALGRLAYSIEATARAIALNRNVGFAWEVVTRQDPIAMDAGFVDAATRLATERGIAHRVMSSGAGHDAMILASAGVPSLMLFVPSQGGVSHHPDELTTPKLLAGGIEFARALLPALTERVAGSAG
ncbi:MAG: Zn-dependent hydrolase [Candidatus Eisenbacteria bacterium]